MQLYNFFRSGTSHRTRIALNLKGLSYDYIPISLGKEEHLDESYKTINPQGLVPALVNDNSTLIQSPAILEWLEETYPEPALLPKDVLQRAHVRALAAMIACDIHPINNRRILEFLRHDFKHSEEDILKWCAEWINAGFSALEEIVRKDYQVGNFCYGKSPTLADCYLVPQMYSARRFNVDLSPYPTLVAIDAQCMLLPAFIQAAPENQPDAPK